MLLLGCAPKVTHREVEANATKKYDYDAVIAEAWCSEQCDKYQESSRVYFAHISNILNPFDFYQCENDPYSICMLDCQNLPATDTTYCAEDFDLDE